VDIFPAVRGGMDGPKDLSAGATVPGFISPYCQSSP